jgi:hypothetical protein
MKHRGNLVQLRTALKSYNNLTVHVWHRGGGKQSFIRYGEEIANAIATCINSKINEEWLIVHHKPRPGLPDLEPAIRSLLSEYNEKVHFITWGNHQATNAFSHVPNVILAGTLFYRASHYESLGRLSAGLPPAKGPYPAEEYEDMRLGEHAHLVLQALCRGTVRNCKGADCMPCNAYIICSPASGIARALPSIFPGCQVADWQPTYTALSHKVKQAIEFIDQWFDENPQEDYLPFLVIRTAIGIHDHSNFKRDIRSNPGFLEELMHRGMIEYGKGRYPKGFLSPSGQATLYGFQDEEAPSS